MILFSSKENTYVYFYITLCFQSITRKVSLQSTSLHLKIIQTIKSAGTKYSGPIPLPTKYEEFTILRSVHINKKSREQFERRTHKRLIVLKETSKELMNKLEKAELPAGVNIEIVVRN